MTLVNTNNNHEENHHPEESSQSSTGTTNTAAPAQQTNHDETQPPPPPPPAAAAARQESRDYDPETRVYTLEQLSVLNLVVHPIWIFDYAQRQMRWANRAGLELFDAASLAELRRRDFRSDMSAAAAQRMEDFLVRFERDGANVPDQWTLYPKGRAKTVHLNVSGVRIADDEDRHMCILCEGLPVVQQDLLNNNLRGVEMLRHLPMAVCQFDMKGETMFQNPEASLEQQQQQATQEEPEDDTNDPATAETGQVEHNQKMAEESLNNGDNSRKCAVGHENGQTATSAASASASTAAASAPAKRKRSTTRDGLLHRFVDPQVGRQVLAEIQSAARSEIDLEAAVHTRNGPTVAALQLRKVHDPVTGEPVILYSARDKTDAVEARKERQAREQKAEFLAILAHELRTPLHQVIGFIDLLDQTALDAEQSSYVRLLRSSARGLLAVISDVLDFSKLEAGKMKLECVPYEPLSVVTGSLESTRASCEEKDLRLNLEWHKDIPFRLKGDPNRLRQILLNLLSNAVKFTSHGGIHVQAFPLEKDSNGIGQQENKDRSSSSSSSSPSLVKFVVSDTGTGISAEEVDVIFLKYQQANVSVAHKYGGTGLGLSICRILVESMGGSIGVDSVPGHGASFWFVLPANIPTDDIDDATESNQEELAPDVGGLRILVAEDNLVNQKLVSKMLTRMGHQSWLAENGKEAIEKVEENEFDVVLMDIQMPVMDGLEATRRLRTMGYTNLPIFALTASVARPDFSDLGFTDWIPKPIPMKDLKAKLYRLQQKNPR